MTMKAEFDKLVVKLKEAKPGQERADAIELIAHAFQHLEASLGAFPNDKDLEAMLPSGWRGTVIEAHRHIFEAGSCFFAMRRAYEKALEEQAQTLNEARGSDVAAYAATGGRG
jgi:hypothetical protein